MSTSPTFRRKQRQPAVGLEEILAGVRMAESGSYKGDYGLVGPRFNGRSYFGAYQISTEYWSSWAALAGISGANMSSPAAQDRVAAYILGEYFVRYGDWNLAAMAWLAGPQEAAKVLRRGYGGVDSIQNPNIRQYVQDVAKHAQWAAENPNAALTRQIPSARFSYATPGSGWVHPVAGASEYSNSFRVPRNNKSGIHGAIDIYAKKGTPIVAPVSGKVLSTKTGSIGGHTVRIQGTDGVIYYFAHMAENAVVSVGDQVLAGHHIGYVGNSGNAQGTSPHLHLSMKRNGALVNPFTYLEQSSTMGVANQMDPNDMLTAMQPVGITNQLNTMLQGMSDSVRAGAQPVPAPEYEDSEIGDKKHIRDLQDERDEATRQEMI